MKVKCESAPCYYIIHVICDCDECGNFLVFGFTLEVENLVTPITGSVSGVTLKTREDKDKNE